MSLAHTIGSRLSAQFSMQQQTAQEDNEWRILAFNEAAFYPPATWLPELLMEKELLFVRALLFLAEFSPMRRRLRDFNIEGRKKGGEIRESFILRTSRIPRPLVLKVIAMRDYSEAAQIKF